MTGATNPLIGYGREGATEAHWVRSIHPPQALCPVRLDSIPLHQIPPARVCNACQQQEATTTPLPASALTGDAAPSGACPACGDPQPLDAAGRIQLHDVERVRSGLTPCDGAGQQPEDAS